MDPRKSSGKLVLFFCVLASVVLLAFSIAWMWSFHHYVTDAAEQMKANAATPTPFFSGFAVADGPELKTYWPLADTQLVQRPELTRPRHETDGPRVISIAAFGALFTLCLVLLSSVVQVTRESRTNL